METGQGERMYMYGDRSVQSPFSLQWLPVSNTGPAVSSDPTADIAECHENSQLEKICIISSVFLHRSRLIMSRPMGNVTIKRRRGLILVTGFIRHNSCLQCTV
jgi:hypothetical protein